MKLIIVKNYEEMSTLTANEIKKQLEMKNDSVLGLATGGTPEGMYAQLIKMNLDWSNVRTFNLDEYVGIDKEHKLSYYTYMHKNLFNHINILQENISIPSGNGDISTNGMKYDEKIDQSGGIDLQILGIGINAHIGFNEPQSSFNSLTREVDLTDSTIEANSRYFKSKDEVPKTAISMGIGSILKSKKIILLASGKNKAEAISKTLLHSIDESVPSSALRNHPNVTLIVDEEAASLLSEDIKKEYI